MTTYKCPFCDFTYVWTLEEQNNAMANRHMRTHEQSFSVPYFWTEVPTLVSSEPVAEPVEPVPEPAA